MRKIELKELKDIQMSILDEFHDYCQKNNLRYSLGYGTLLGAVRHKGFIPWDDDIDLMMPRKDYDIFLQNFSHEDLNIFSYETDKHYPFAFCKLGRKDTILKNNPGIPSYVGVHLDILPLDGVQKNKTIRKLYSIWVLLLVHIYYIRCMSFKRIRSTERFKNERVDKKTIHLICKLISFIFPLKFLFKTINFFSKRYEFDNSKYVTCLIGATGTREITEYKYMSTYIDILFEKKLYKAISGYKKNLSNRYGDYMKLPPLEEQIRHSDEFWAEF